MKASLKAFTASFTVALVGCLSPPVEAPTTTVTQVTPIRVSQTPQNKVDILFMVDNSASMAAMQDQLKQHFTDFFQVFQNLAMMGTYADLQIGVVTSDYGAGNTASASCDASPGGQKGILQKLGKAAAASCQPPTDNFIKFVFGATGDTSNLSGGSDLTRLVDTFTCMASGITAGGQVGCGFEHQLESVYAALHNTNENAGFLRSDALLTVVFVTNEDDGSAPPSATFYAQNAPPADGAYTTYRQTQFGVQCGSPEMLAPYAASMGMLSACQAAPNPMTTGDLEYDISRYINYLTLSSAQGGVKPNPNDVILVAIDAPETPFETILSQTGTGGGAAPTPSYVPCGALSSNCEVHLQHSCQNMIDPAFFGDPPVRLNAVVNAAKYHQIANICGDDLTMQPNYTSALQNLGNLITSNIGLGCLPQKIADVMAPDCVVTDVSPNMDGTVTQATIPICASTTAGPFPCWTVATKAGCSMLSPQGIGLTVERGGQAPPKGTYLDVECATIAAQKS